MSRRIEFKPCSRIVERIANKPLRFASELNILSAEVLVNGGAAEERFSEIEKQVEVFKDKLPYPSLLLKLAEMWLALGNEQKAEVYLQRARGRDTLYLHLSDPGLIFNQIALMQAKMGLKAEALEENYSFLKDFPRGDIKDESYRSLAMTAADCMHIYKECSERHIIERSIQNIRKKAEREDAYGLVARKLCMRNESEPAEAELISFAETFLPKLSNPPDRIFTNVQLGIAKALKGDQAGAEKHFNLCKAMLLKASEVVRFLGEMNLFRAYVQVGFAPEAEELKGKLKNQFEELLMHYHDVNTVLERGAVNYKLPKELKELRDRVEEFGNMLDVYIKGIISAFILAGRLPNNTLYLDDAEDMVDRILGGYDKFSLYLELSEAHALKGQSEKSIEMLNLAVEQLKHANKKAIRAIFSDVASTCATNFFSTGDEKYVDDLLRYGQAFSVRAGEMSDACFQFCYLLSALAVDRRWGIIFYVH